MSFLAVTLPVSLLLAAALVGLVLHGVRRGDFDDWEGPAARHAFDDDRHPELETPGDVDGAGPGPTRRRG